MHGIRARSEAKYHTHKTTNKQKPKKQVHVVSKPDHSQNPQDEHDQKDGRRNMDE